MYISKSNQKYFQISEDTYKEWCRENKRKLTDPESKTEFYKYIIEKRSKKND